MTSATRYAFDNNDAEAADRHRYLAAMFDDVTATRLTSLGELAGKRCLELGAGGGSMAGWLAARGARVLATDLNIRHLPTDAPFEVRQHDLQLEHVPEGPWDLIHARLVLLHLPERETVLKRLAEALAPGGALVVEDFETTFRKAVLRAPTPADEAVYEAYHTALIDHVMPGVGNDPAWAGRVHAAMYDAGLTTVDTEIHARSWNGGSPGALLVAANIAQQRASFQRAGMSDLDLDRVVKLMSDPYMVVRGHLLYSTVGYRASA